MYKPLKFNGKEYSEADSYRSAKATERPRAIPQADGDGGEETDAKPVHTAHNPDGSHTTTHEDGHEHNSQNLEELKAHLDKFLSEEQHEGSDEDNWDEAR